MARSARATSALLVLLASQLLHTPSAKVLEEEGCASASAPGANGSEACVPPPARGVELLQKAKGASHASMGQSDGEQAHATHRRRRRSDYCVTRDESFCPKATRYRPDYCIESDCGLPSKPGPNTPDCTVNSGGKICRCKGRADCNVDALRSSVHYYTPAVGRCHQRSVYITGGGAHFRKIQHGEELNWYEGKEGVEIYCSKMVKYDRWAAKHYVASSGDGPVKQNWGKWECKWNWRKYKWENNGCWRKGIRYLGEPCESDVDCAGRSDFDQHRTTCAGGKCVPRGLEPQETCQCHDGVISGSRLRACTATPSGLGPCKGTMACLQGPDGRRVCDATQLEF